MTASINGVTPSYGLLRATEAVTNWRALAATGLAGLAILLSVFLGVLLAKVSFIFTALCGLLTLIVALTGYSAVGILLMRQAQQQPVSIADAFGQAVFTVHRLLGVLLMMFLIVLGISLIAMLVLFLCKLPGVGGLLYALAMPVLTVLIGVAVGGMFYVGLALAGPAIWEGNTVWQTTARLLVIVRQRLVTVIVNLVLLGLLVMLLSGVVYVVLGSGYAITTMLSGAVGINTFGSLLSSPAALLGGYGGAGYAGASMFATGLLLMVGAIIPSLTSINGACLVYLQIVEGLNFGEAEQQIQARMEEAKRKAKEAKDRASAQMQQAKAAAQRPDGGADSAGVQPAEAGPAATFAAAVPVAATAGVPAQRVCSGCAAPLAPEDVFCGECGAKNG